MSKIYVVTEGEYSDYHVVAVFDNKDEAEQYAHIMAKSDVEEYELNPELPTWINPNLQLYYVWMQENGDSTCYQRSYDLNNKEKYPQIHWDEKYRYPSGWVDKVFEGYQMLITVQAKDEKHAVKIANEKRIQLIANNQWGKKV